MISSWQGTSAHRVISSLTPVRHTHGGQVCVPFTRTPVIAVIRHIWKALSPFPFLRSLLPGRGHMRATRHWRACCRTVSAWPKGWGALSRVLIASSLLADARCSPHFLSTSLEVSALTSLPSCACASSVIPRSLYLRSQRLWHHRSCMETL